MGIFKFIGNQFDNAKERARLEALPILNYMEESSLEDSALLLIRTFNKGTSIMAKSTLLQAFQKKVSSTDNTKEIFYAFSATYEIYNCKHDTIALNISQILGRRLYNDGDSRVYEKEFAEGRTLLVPR